MSTTKTTNMDFLILKHISGPFQENKMIKNFPVKKFISEKIEILTVS